MPWQRSHVGVASDQLLYQNQNWSQKFLRQNRGMGTTKTFSGCSYFYWCTVSEPQPGVFNCAVAFAVDRNSKAFRTIDLKLDGAFASADLAMGVGERYGRSMIKRHGDVARYLASQGLTGE